MLYSKHLYRVTVKISPRKTWTGDRCGNSVADVTRTTEEYVGPVIKVEHIACFID